MVWVAVVLTLLLLAAYLMARYACLMTTIEDSITQFSQTAEQEGYFEAIVDQIGPVLFVFWILVLPAIWLPDQMQAVFLLLAFVTAACYAWHAKEQVKATQLLAGKAILFILEPIKSFSPDSDGPCTKWLTFDLVNVGDWPAVNIDASVSDEWMEDQYKDITPQKEEIGERQPYEHMKEECGDAKDLGKASGPEAIQLWRERCLYHKGHSFFCFPAPELEPKNDRRMYELTLRWYDSNFVRWHSIVKVFWNDDDNQWCTNWDKAKPSPG